MSIYKDFNKMVKETNIMDLEYVKPNKQIKFTYKNKMIEKLWNIALSDVEKNRCVDTPYGKVYSAGGYGKEFFGMVFTRDTSYSGLLALNALYPNEMLECIKAVRNIRLNLGFACFREEGNVLEGIDDVVIYDIPKIEFFKKFQKASAINKTDDVVWVWCAYDLLKKNKFGMSEWNWLYHMGVGCFEKLYNRFYDPNDGLYYGRSRRARRGIYRYGGTAVGMLCRRQPSARPRI